VYELFTHDNYFSPACDEIIYNVVPLNECNRKAIGLRCMLLSYVVTPITAQT
jgi:hypothetical protein